MRLYVLRGLCLILLLVSSMQAIQSQAQADSTWSITLFDSSSNSLVLLSQNVEEHLLVPQSLYEEPFLNNSYAEIEHRFVSDDTRYLITFAQRLDPYDHEGFITDLLTGETRSIEKPPLQENEYFVSYDEGLFSPDMTAVVLPYVSDLPTGMGCCNSGGIIVVDLDSGSILNHLDIAENYRQATAWIDEWTEEGIWFGPHCTSCEPDYRYASYLWNPVTGTIADDIVIRDRRYTQRLSSTGELLYSEDHPDFPLGGGSYPPRRNVISLYQEDETPTSAEGQVIYYNAEYPASNPYPRWIMSGQTFLVNEDDLHNAIVFRDGESFRFDYDVQQNFLAMTDDGWLTIDREKHTIRQFTVAGFDVSGRILYETDAEIEIVNNQPSPAIEDLPEISIDIPPPNVRFCPGALPTRLEPGDQAEITANQEEITIARLMIGDVAFEDLSYSLDNSEILPLGAHIEILDGFACTPDGWGFLKVSYEGRVGWILEVIQTYYYLAPISD